MHKQQEVQSILESILGSRNVYFQPPASVQIKFPAFIYFTGRVNDRFADDSRYLKRRPYEVQYVSKTFDEKFVNDMLELPYCELNTTFKKDNVYHYNFTIYF